MWEGNEEPGEDTGEGEDVTFWEADLVNACPMT